MGKEKNSKEGKEMEDIRKRGRKGDRESRCQSLIEHEKGTRGSRR